MTNNMPLISVVMPVYNGERYLRETIESVLKQTYQNFEFIIVNDGSIDSTQQVLESYDDGRIVLLNLTSNQGVSNARNIGIDRSRGEFIAFCDSDDVYDMDRLKIQLDYLLNNPSVDVCGSYFILVESDKELLIAQPLTDLEIKDHFFTGNCIGQPSVMCRSSVFRNFKYNSKLQASEDYDLWARMAIGGVSFANVPIPLVKYRIHSAQASKIKGRLLDDTSRAVSLNYALSYLNSYKLTEYSKSSETSIVDFRKFVAELSFACDKKSSDLNLFRPLIAFQYKKLNSFRLSTFVMLMQLISKYHIDFPANYLLNIFLLSILPIRKKCSLFDTLTKLKL